MKVTDKTVCVFETESGSRYKINRGLVRRLNSGYGKRGDGDWWKLYDLPELWIGTSALLVMESLSHLGADDESGLSGDVTVRTTTPVTRIERFNDDEEDVPF